jgi:hypothetical protein
VDEDGSEARTGYISNKEVYTGVQPVLHNQPFQLVKNDGCFMDHLCPHHQGLVS